MNSIWFMLLLSGFHWSVVIDGERVEYELLSISNSRITYAMRCDKWPEWGQPGGMRETGTVSFAELKWTP